jgi:hypothetical protein
MKRKQELTKLMARNTRRKQQRESAQRCREWITDGYLRDLLNKQKVRDGFGRNFLDYYNDREIRGMMEQRRNIIWAKRLLYDQPKWKNHPALKELLEQGGFKS